MASCAILRELRNETIKYQPIVYRFPYTAINEAKDSPSPMKADLASLH
jgi:hypothetical protein